MPKYQVTWNVKISKEWEVEADSEEEAELAGERLASEWMEARCPILTEDVKVSLLGEED